MSRSSATLKAVVERELTRDEISTLLPTKGDQESLKLLTSILKWRRAMDSIGEAKMIQDIIMPLSPDIDKAGNLYVKIGDSRVIWSSHTDSVHHDNNTCNMQSLAIVERDNIPFMVLGDKSKKSGNCLGADDGAGIFLMIEMIKAKIPGLYIFHRGEESGCIGSGWIAENRRNMLSKYDYCISFDRADTYEIITHQSGRRTASDMFAESMAKQLNSANKAFEYEPSPNGSYTDSNEYRAIIPECANIGVGYYRQHGPTESQNLYHLFALRDALLSFEESHLECGRDPSKIEDDWSDWNADSFDDVGEAEALIELIAEYPDMAAKVLMDYGAGYDDIAGEVLEDYGYLPTMARC